MKPLTILYCLLISVFFSDTCVFAQKVSYGVKGGGNVGALRGPYGENDSGSPSLKPNLGVYVQYKLGTKWLVLSELGYSGTGVNYQRYIPPTDTLYGLETAGGTFFIETIYTAEAKGEYSLGYVDLPISVLYQFSEKLGLNIGTRFAYLIQGKNAGEAIVDVGEAPFFFSENSLETFDESDSLNKLDFGFVGGGRLQVNPRLVVSLSANYGILSIQEISDLIPNDYYNLYLSTSLAYQLGGRKERN